MLLNELNTCINFLHFHTHAAASHLSSTNTNSCVCVCACVCVYHLQLTKFTFCSYLHYFPQTPDFYINRVCITYGSDSPTNLFVTFLNSSSIRYAACDISFIFSSTLYTDGLMVILPSSSLV